MNELVFHRIFLEKKNEMLLGLANASIRKMLTHLLHKVIAFFKHNMNKHTLDGAHTFHGYIIIWSTRFSLLINEIDYLYDEIYNNSGLNIPTRFEIPNPNHLSETFKNNQSMFLHDCVEFVKNTDKYLQVYDYIFHTLQNTNCYVEMQGNVFKNASNILKGHILDIIGPQKMISFLKTNVEDSDIILEIFYKPLALIGPNFFKS